MHSATTSAAQSAPYKAGWLSTWLTSASAAWAVLHDIRWRAPWDPA